MHEYYNLSVFHSQRCTGSTKSQISIEKLKAYMHAMDTAIQSSKYYYLIVMLFTLNTCGGR